MIKLKFHSLTQFNAFLKSHIDLVESFDQDSAILIESELGKTAYDVAETIEGIDQEFGSGFTYESEADSTSG